MSSILSATAHVQVGQVIYTGLYNRGFGVVVAIRGEQAPETIRGTVVRMGGRAEFDIVFNGGQRTVQLPESILRGVQWTIYDEVVSAEQVQAYLFKAEEYAEQKAMEKAAADAQFSMAVAALKVDPALAHLEALSDNTGRSEQAPKNIRKDLKKHFPGVKFSVRTSRSSSVTVSWTDGPTDAQVEAVVNRYKAGSFDGMTDCYEFHRSPFGDVFGSVQYVSTRREESEELKAYAIAEAFRRYAVDLQGVEVPSVEEYKRGNLYLTPVCCGVRNVRDLQGLIRSIAYNTRCTDGGMVTEMED